MMKDLMKFLVSAMVLVASMSISTVANAHQIRLSVYVEGNLVEGEVYFVGGGSPPGAGANVELIKQGNVIQAVIADDEGLFTFGEITPDSYTVRADGGQGHVAFYELDKSEFLPEELAVSSESKQIEQSSSADATSPSVTSQELQKAIAHAIRPLREQLDRYEAKTRLHDILGGIGYIFGLFGVLVLVRNRKQQVQK